MRALVLAEVRAIRTRKVTKAALVPLLFLMQRINVREQLRMSRRSISTLVAHIRSVSCMRTLMVVLGLVRGERLVTTRKATGVWSVPRMSKKMTAQFGTLLEVFVARFAAFPLAEASRTAIDMSGLEVLVKSLWSVKRLETSHARDVLPSANTGHRLW
jgi:hypothetical protein